MVVVFVVGLVVAGLVVFVGVVVVFIVFYPRNLPLKFV